MTSVSVRMQRSTPEWSPVTRPLLNVVPIVPPVSEPALLTDTSVHHVAVAIPVLSSAWFLLAAWIAFAGGETSLILTVETFLSVMYFGLIVGGGAFSGNMTLGRARTRTFSEFLDGEVDIATGRIGGRVALWQIAAMPVALAIGGTSIVAFAVLTRI